ncbi:hypothetical protein GHT06_010059 [Daphnia sinensis]|uniref:BCL2-associated athanogene 6 n=1 Tax=Daphnia sinensis TaxID=1820382 RepID=A0AAD5Q0R9_9CRUS|nr:hypothetical protein GHT06_010059 [Daphnia sinensis]
MANIEVTVKTLDSRNHKFTVSEQLTVKELKEHIAGDVATPAETQRLIYCGRVLQDDKKLSEYDLNGKVVHLVQRAPPSVGNPPAGAPRTQGSRPGNIHYHLDRGFQNGASHIIGPVPPPAGSSSLLRLNTARHMLEDASQSLGRISSVPSGTSPLFTMDNTVEGPYSSPAMPFAQAATAAALAAAFSTVQSMGANNITVLQGPNGTPAVQGSFGFRVQGPQPNNAPDSSGGTSESGGSTVPPATAPPSSTTSSTPSSTPSSTAPAADQPPQQQQQQQQIRNPRVSVFADVIEDMERLQQDLRPHLTAVRQLLRDDPVLNPLSAEYRQAQHTFNQVAEGLHYLAHAFHAMSDLMVDFGTPPPREVRARPYVYQQAVLSSTIPIHASISVETTHTHRHPQANPSAGNPTAATPQPSQAPPRLPTTNPRDFVRHVTRPEAAAGAANQSAAPTASPTFLGWRASIPVPGATPNAPPGQNVGAPRAPVQMLHPDMLARGGHPHPFGRLPLAMASQGGWTPVNLGGQMHPMVYMEVRSNNNQQEDQPSSPGQSPTALGEFDDFLPCHSRHLSRSSTRTDSEQARPRPTVVTGPAQAFTMATETNQAHPARTGSQTTAIPASVDEFMNEMFRQVTASSGGGDGRVAGGVIIGGAGGSDNTANPVLTNAMFSSLLQGVMQEVAGVVSGHQSPNTVAHFLRNIPDFTYTAGESFLFDLFMTMADHMTFRDLMALFYGMPEALNQMRDHLRNFTRQRVLPSGGDFSDPSVRQGIMTLVSQALPLLQSAAAEASIRPDVDFVATMAQFIQQRLHEVVQLIGMPGENPDFGRLMMDKIRRTLIMAAALALSCFTDGSTSLERVFLSQLRGVSDGVHPAVQEWTTNSSIERLRTLLASVDLDQLTPTVEPMVMNVERGRTWTALFNAEVEEMNDREPSASAAPEAPTVSPPAAMGSTSEEEPMEVVVEKKDEALTIVQGQPRQRSRLEKLRQEVAEGRQKEANRVKTPEPVIDVVVGSQTWHNEVPREWVPVIARDIQRQSRAPPPVPLSDAYLAGIPSKRRKLAEGNRPNTNPQLLLRETIERALRSANVSSATVNEVTNVATANVEVGSAFLPEVRRLGNARLDRDTDFDAERFPNAERFFHGGT